MNERVKRVEAEVEAIEKEAKNKIQQKTEEEKLHEIEKKLGRHKTEKVIKNKKEQKLIKYFLLATNMMYILAGPVVVMLGLYLLIKKYILHKEYPLMLIIFLFLGAISGYWSLIKQLTTMNKKEDKEREKEKNGKI